MVLQGAGSGRATAGLHLLTQLGCQKVVRLNPAWRLFEVKPDELRDEEGYLWESTGPGSTVLTDADFEHICRLVRDRKTLLVIIVDEVSRLIGATGYIVELKPPLPEVVARRFIRAERPHDQSALTALDWLAEKLAAGDPPQKAVRAGELAVLVAQGNISPDEALRELTTNVDREVAQATEKSWSADEYALQLAVAVLEDRPLDEVVAFAGELSLKIREAEAPQGRPPRPRRLFAKPLRELLGSIRAVTDLRDHPQHSGLTEYTVRFARPDWGSAVLRRFWEQYHVDRQKLVEWICLPRVYDEPIKAGVHGNHGGSGNRPAAGNQSSRRE